MGYYHDRGLRQRTLNLPVMAVMAALVLSLIGRPVGSVSELARALTSAGLLWAGPVPISQQVSQQAIPARLRTFPAELFARILEEILPRRVWYAEDPAAPDLRTGGPGPGSGRPSRPAPCSWPTWPPASTSFGVFAEVTAAEVTFLVGAKQNLAAEVVRPLRRTATVQAALVAVGRGAERQGARAPGRQGVRLIAVSRGGVWDRYLTNELDPDRLPAEQVVALYAAWWRIEEAFSSANAAPNRRPKPPPAAPLDSPGPDPTL